MCLGAMHFFYVSHIITCPEMNKYSNCRVCACFVYSPNLKLETSAKFVNSLWSLWCPHVDQYPKTWLHCPLSYYTSDFLRCHSLCCTCVLQTLVISSSVWWFSFNWWFAHICVLQLDHLLECAVAYPSDYKTGQGCWRLSPAVAALPLLRASSYLWHSSSASAWDICRCWLLLSTS